MTWMTSDWVVLLLTAVCILNLLIAFLSVSRGFLERHFDRQQTDWLLKAAIVYMLFFIPVISGCILYFSTFHGSRPLEWSDGEQSMVYIIGNRTFSTETGLGNHPFFILFFAVWLTGVLYFGVYRRIKDSRLLRRMERNSVKSKDAGLSELKEELKKEYEIPIPVEILVSDLVFSPFTEGTVRCRIFFPKDGYEEESREMMLRHELIHCKKQDILYRRLLFWLCALYWFNPFVYRLADYFVEINEMACDERVLEHASKKMRYEYAKLLADAARMEETCTLPKPALLFSGRSESGLERRIENMMKKRNKTVKNRMAYAVFSLLLAAVFPLTTCAAADGISKLQSAAAQAMVEEQEEFMQSPDMWKEVYEMNTNENVREVQTDLAARGMTEIDENVSGKEQVTIATLTLTKGTVVQIYLMGDSTTDKFRAGLEDSSGWKNYVSASNGEIAHTFTIAAKGTYKVFMEGTTDKNIHACGMAKCRYMDVVPVS